MSILSAEIKSAEAELSKIPYEKLRKFDFWSQPGMSNNQQVIYGMAQDTVQYEREAEMRNQRLASKWQVPAKVVLEKEFMEATEFLLKLHPDAQQAAIDILAANIKENNS